MRSVTRLAGRIAGTLLTIGALLPGLALAQSATAAKPDSAAKKDSAAHVAAGHRSRFGALGRATIAKANAAADRVEQTTGVSKETMAKAALASTGVGAATMLVGHDSGSTTANATLSAGRSALQRLKEAHDEKARNARAQAAAGTTPGAMTGAMADLQKTLHDRLAATGQANAAASQPAAYGGSPEMQRLQAEYAQINMRAASGDAAAGRQLARFAQEWGGEAPRIATLPADRQQAAYESAMRDALACATRGEGCKH